MDRLLKTIINSYPLLWPRFYAYLRMNILRIDQIEKVLPEQGKILDIGCGYGVTTAYFAMRNDKRDVVGTELVSKRIAIATEAFKNVKNLKFDVKNLLDGEENRYDVIVAIDLLHHITDQEKELFIKKSIGHLEKNGLLIIKDIDKSPYYKYIWNYIHDKIMTRFEKLYFYSADQMRALIESNGLIIVQENVIKNIFYPHVIFICRYGKTNGHNKKR